MLHEQPVHPGVDEFESEEEEEEPEEVEGVSEIDSEHGDPALSPPSFLFWQSVIRGQPR
jgi:hypothetical protein